MYATRSNVDLFFRLLSCESVIEVYETIIIENKYNILITFFSHAFEIGFPKLIIENANNLINGSMKLFK